MMAPERILITGITGFVGSHLADFIFALPEASKRYEIYGTRRWHLSRMENVRKIEDRIRWVDVNFTDPIAVRNLIEEVKPDRVFHFAAESFVGASWKHPTHYMNVNYNGTVHLLDALVQICSKAPVHIPGSSEEFGDVPESSLPIREETALNPVSPYAVSKVAQDLIGNAYFHSYGLNIIRTRAFNHEGPRRDKVFGIPWYAYQLARMEKGLQERVLKVGHIQDCRNFTHVKDMVEAYWLASHQCIPGELYLIGSDEPEAIYSFEEALHLLIGFSKVGNVQIEVEPKFVRPAHVPRLICDSSKFRGLTGWRPKISFEQTLKETLDYWRIRADIF